jgi:hypothetical protein
MAGGAREQERAGTGVDAARAGGVTLMRERHANQAALGRGSQRGDTDMLDASDPERAMACRTRASAVGARPGRRRVARSEQ